MGTNLNTLDITDYKIYWGDSENTESLKLQMLDEVGYAIGGFSFIDFYQDGVHTIAVVEDCNNCIFLVFKLKFDEDLSSPLIKFVEDTVWCIPYTDEVDNHCGLTIDSIDRTDYPDLLGTEFDYEVLMPIYTNGDALFEFEGHYKGTRVENGIINENTRVYAADFEYEANKSPLELLDSKTALKIKLLRMGR